MPKLLIKILNIKGNIKIVRLIKFYLLLIKTHQDFMP